MHRAPVCPFIPQRDRPLSNRRRTKPSVPNGPRARPGPLLVWPRPRHPHTLRRRVAKSSVGRPVALPSERLVVRLPETRVRAQPPAQQWVGPLEQSGAGGEGGSEDNYRRTLRRRRPAVRMHTIGRWRRACKDAAIRSTEACGRSRIAGQLNRDQPRQARGASLEGSLTALTLRKPTPDFEQTSSPSPFRYSIWTIRPRVSVESQL